MANKSRNRHRSYSSALKRINLILKPINEQYNNGYGDSLYEQNDEKEKFVLKTPESEDDMDMDDEMSVDVDVDMDDMDMEDDMDMGDDMDMEDDMDMDGDMDDDMDGDMGDEAGEGKTSIKSIQKLTGKLGQKMRELEDEVDSNTIKYVLNSIISAIDLDQLDDEDREDIVDRLDPEEDEDYGMEDDFEVDMGDDMDDMEMDVEDMEDDMDDMDMEMDDEDMEDESQSNNLEESLKRRVNNTLTSYYKDSDSEKRINESRVKNYLRKNINKSKTKNSLSNLCETIEQEITLKKVLSSDKGYKYSKKTKKGGVVVLENNRQTIGITRHGKIIK